MKILIIESCEKKINSDYSNTSIVHVRNSLIISDILGADLITHETDIPKFIDNKYDYIICMYASPYMKWKKYIKILEKNMNAKLIWLVNDHDLEDNILLRQAILYQDRKYSVICNNPQEGYRHWILGKNILDKKLKDFICGWTTINLNVLIFTTEKRVLINDGLFNYVKKGLVYYGTFRKYRTVDILKYNGLEYTISTSKKNQIKYLNSGIKSNLIGRLDWTKGKETLVNFKYSIYFEDLHTHTNYAYMANRYYECLMCGVLMFFDDTCIETIKKSNYKVPEYLIVSGKKDLEAKIKAINLGSDLYRSLLTDQESNFEAIIEEKRTVVKSLKELL